MRNYVPHVDIKIEEASSGAVMRARERVMIVVSISHSQITLTRGRNVSLWRAYDNEKDLSDFTPEASSHGQFRSCDRRHFHRDRNAESMGADEKTLKLAAGEADGAKGTLDPALSNSDPDAARI